MSEEIVDVEQEVVSPDDVNEEVINPEVEEDISEEATPQQADIEEEEAPIEEQKVPYDRFQEVNEERKWLKAQHEALLARQQTPTQPQTPEVDPYAGMDPATAQFYRDMDKRTQNAVNKALSVKEKEYNQQITSMRNVIGQMQAKEFRKEFPDVKSGSQEEAQIASYIKAGYPPQHAYWVTMGPKGVQKAETRAVKKVKQKVQMKKQANTEVSGGVSKAAQPQGNKSFRDTAREMFAKAERGEL